MTTRGNPQGPNPLVKSTNPKDKLAVNRVPLWLIPSTASVEVALAHLDGALKYGPYNWREHGVCASVYASAAKRHIDKFMDGLDYADDSGVHELAHAIAGLNILLDAILTGNVVDDRPPCAPTNELMNEAKDRIEEMVNRARERG